jgi:hypothetical protein
MAAKKKKTTKPYGNKTKFVLGLSRDLSAKQVVEEAKKNGITITEAHVYKIRSTAKAKGGKSPGRPAKAAARGRAAAGRKAAAAAPRGRASAAGLSKRDFVLGFGSDTPASEILRKAKEQGIGLSKAYLYTIRSSGGASQKRGRPAKAAVATKGRASATKATKATKASFRKGSRGGANSLETQFLDAAMDLGLAKATELLGRLRTRAKSY